jgi:hypothetical protein
MASVASAVSEDSRAIRIINSLNPGMGRDDFIGR